MNFMFFFITVLLFVGIFCLVIMAFDKRESTYSNAAFTLYLVGALSAIFLSVECLSTFVMPTELGTYVNESNTPERVQVLQKKLFRKWDIAEYEVDSGEVVYFHGAKILDPNATNSVKITCADFAKKKSN